MMNLLTVCFNVFSFVFRTFIYPLQIKGGKPTSLFVFFSALLTTAVNGYIQGAYHSKYASYPESWIYNLNFIIGIHL